MYPIIFSVGQLNVYTHGVMIALGALVGGLAIYLIGRRNDYNNEYHIEYLFDLIVFSLLGGIIGARILYVIIYFNQFYNYKEMFFIWYGGLVSFGGMVGGFLTAWLILNKRKEPVLKWFDLGMIGLLIGWAFGRIGCLLAGDSFGVYTTSIIAIWGRIPTQIFESVWVLICAGLLFLLLRKKEDWQLPNGVIFLSGIGLYSLGRFTIDFFRDEEIFFRYLHASQWGSLLIFIVVVVVLWQLLKGRKVSRNGNESF